MDAWLRTSPQLALSTTIEGPSNSHLSREVFGLAHPIIRHALLDSDMIIPSSRPSNSHLPREVFGLAHLIILHVLLDSDITIPSSRNHAMKKKKVK